MKGPRRLIHDDPGFGRLVDAMRKDGPSEGQMSKALSVATEIASLPPSRGTTSWLGRTALHLGLTVVVIAGLLAAVVVSTTGYEGRATASAAPSLSISAASIVTSAIEPPIASVRVDDLPSAPVAPAPEVAVQASSRTKSVEPGDAPARGGGPACPPDGAAAPGSPCRNTGRRGTFAEELALTSEARAALERGDIASCLKAVDRYQRSFRGGIFAQEIDVIRIEALAKSGARERAHSSAEQFLRANATSPYADRVRSVFESTK
jgi:hypothetical protein